MKTNFFQLSTLVLLVFSLSLANLYAQNQVVGTYNSTTKEIKFTGDATRLKADFETFLGNDGAKLTSLTIIGNVVGENSKFLLGGPVINDPQKVSYLSLELIKIGGELVLERGGPVGPGGGGGGGSVGISHSCTGDPCTSCRQYVDGALQVHCSCDRCDSCQSNQTGHCNHSVTVGF